VQSPFTGNVLSEAKVLFEAVGYFVELQDLQEVPNLLNPYDRYVEADYYIKLPTRST